MKYAISVACFTKQGGVCHAVGVIEANSDDEALGKGYRVGRIHFPETDYTKHHVTIQSCDVVWED